MLSHVVMLAWTFSYVWASDRSIKLAKHPDCSRVQGSIATNMNKGLDLSKIKTIVGFGDSWINNGQSTGDQAPPPIQKGNSPLAGGRDSNGLVWIEYAAKKIKAKLKDYAKGGSVVDVQVWPSLKNVQYQSDMVQQVSLYLKQKNSLDPNSTIAIISYGINDALAAMKDGKSKMSEAADAMLGQITLLLKSGLKQILVVGPSWNDQSLIAPFNDKIFSGLKNLNDNNKASVGYVEINSLMNAIISNPTSFGFTDSKSCVQSFETKEGACSDPDAHVYYLPYHPSTATHKLLSQWVLEALKKCK